ncbi:MAG: glucose 1-dehydrogenase [Coriobacteriia bacterium]|nr:glucose 1-dehydrogenase [Coriobacteriia bacterium]
MGQLEGKVAIITGAGSGMGRAMAVRFGKEGAKVVAVDYAGESAEETCGLVRGPGCEAVAVRGDISDPADIDAAMQAAIGGFGRLDILCNNAGIIDMAGLMDTDWDYWDRVLRINLKGVAMFSQKAVPEMLKQGKGSIVNTASIAGLVGGAGGLSYTASKHGVVGITKSMAIELSPQGIRVNAICPGAVTTGMTTDFQGVPGFVEGNAIPRWGTADEIANMALFLASDESSFITGAAYPVDGGWVAK